MGKPPKEICTPFEDTSFVDIPIPWMGNPLTDRGPHWWKRIVHAEPRSLAFISSIHISYSHILNPPLTFLSLSLPLYPPRRNPTSTTRPDLEKRGSIISSSSSPKKPYKRPLAHRMKNTCPFSTSSFHPLALIPSSSIPCP